MWVFLASTVGKYVVGGLVAAIIAGGGFLWVKTHYENVGYQKALAAVAAQDARAVAAASDVKKKVDACFDSGREWNVENGACEAKN